MTVIVEQDTSLVESFQASLGGGSKVVHSLDQLEEHLRQNPREFAVVFGVSVAAEAAAAFAAEARIHRPQLGVILVRSRVDSTVLAQALRAGMREVVESRDLTGLAEAVRRAYAVWQAISENVGQIDQAPVSTGSLLTVFATKGGVGKSMVATNLAAALADQGHRTCIVDLDLHSGDVALMLQVTPLRTLSDLSAFAGALDAGAVESLLTRHSDRLSVMAAPVLTEGHENVSAEAVGTMLAHLKTMFDVVVVDTSGSFDDHALHAIDLSDVLVLVGTLDIPALKSLKLAAGTLDLLDLPRDRWRLVLNRADAKVGLSQKDFEETVGIEAAVALPSSRDVLAAVNRGEPVVRAAPGNPVSKSIARFATSLVARSSAGSPGGAPDATRGRRRRTSRQKGALT